MSEQENTSKYGKTISKVRELCARDTGASLREVADAIERPLNVASTYVVKLTKIGEAVKVGCHGEYRYFFDREKAAEFDVKAKAELAKQLEESERRKREMRSKAEREKRAKRRADMGLPPYDPNNPATFFAGRKSTKPKTAKRVRASQPRKQRQHVDIKKLHLSATVVWPEHIQIQKVPAGRDTRFTFDPPPGWRGQITEDWMNRRLGSV